MNTSRNFVCRNLTFRSTYANIAINRLSNKTWVRMTNTPRSIGENQVAMESRQFTPYSLQDSRSSVRQEKCRWKTVLVNSYCSITAQSNSWYVFNLYVIKDSLVQKWFSDERKWDITLHMMHHYFDKLPTKVGSGNVNLIIRVDAACQRYSKGFRYDFYLVYRKAYPVLMLTLWLQVAMITQDSKIHKKILVELATRVSGSQHHTD